jgi:putative RNA 2'-phosphotransferase
MRRPEEPAGDRTLISKTLSFWLRHQPEAAALTLDQQGWTDVSAILSAFQRIGVGCNRKRLLEVIASNDKQRFELSADGQRVRARQGHSIAVSLEWPRRTPPALLYHGTVEPFLAAIRTRGLQPMRRHHVHLSPDVETARRVGARRGRPIILSIRASELDAAGQAFFLTSNGVWLTDAVLPEYLDVVELAR